MQRLTKTDGEFGDSPFIASIAEQAKSGYSFFQYAWANGSPMSKAKRLTDNPDYHRMPDVAQQGRCHISGLSAKKRSKAIRVNLSKECRSRMLKPVISRYAIHFDMEF
jgi:hypothetical protein